MENRPGLRFLVFVDIFGYIGTCVKEIFFKLKDKKEYDVSIIIFSFQRPNHLFYKAVAFYNNYN